jgi:large subunit ribosomal protein L28
VAQETVGDNWCRTDGSRLCREYAISREKTIFGRSISGAVRPHLGGVGKKVTGVTRRKFKPNIQKVRAVVNGRDRRIRVSAKAIRMGLIQKPLKRNYKAGI